MKTLIALCLLLTTIASAQAACTPWVKKRGVSCVRDGDSVQAWARQCTNRYQIENICMDEDPNLLDQPCTEWKPVHGVTCHGGGEWGMKWTRECTVRGFKEVFCSSEINPNDL